MPSGVLQRQQSTFRRTGYRRARHCALTLGRVTLNRCETSHLPMMPAKLPIMIRRAASAAALSLCLAGCATPGGDSADAVNDPLEPVNRVVFGFNEVADKAVIRPAAEVYVFVTPDPLRDAVHAFIRNLLSPLVVANQLLQGDVQGAIDETGRFMTNTILGAGGIADVATQAAIPNEQEDFGQTLAVWGIDSGPYLVLPLLGPSTVRDAVGYGVDTVADPIRLWGQATDHEDLLLARTLTGGIDRRSRYLKEVDDLRRNSLDYYATIRSLYAQQRAAQIRDSNGKDSVPDFPDYNIQGSGR